MKKAKFDINDIYEKLNDGVRDGHISHNDVFSMIKDFVDDTLYLKKELELSNKSIDDLEHLSMTLLMTMKNKQLSLKY